VKTVLKDNYLIELICDDSEVLVVHDSVKLVVVVVVVAKVVRTTEILLS
jgi:hypothetical protein